MLRNDAFKFMIGTSMTNEIICNIMRVQSKLEKKMTVLNYWILNWNIWFKYQEVGNKILIKELV